MFDFDVLRISAVDVDDDERGPDPMALATVHLNAPVGELPRAPLLAVPPEATLATAIEVMRQRGRGAALVVREQRPIGVVTDRDILTQACGDIDHLGEVPVSAVMGPSAAPLRATDTVGTALRRMCAARQWHLPLVCERGLVLGAVDVTDLSLWLRDRMTLMSVDAALGTLWARGG